MNQGPLARFKVIDLSRVRAGPTAVRQLADWGANCIKIEMPEHMADAEGMVKVPTSRTCTATSAA